MQLVAEIAAPRHLNPPRRNRSYPRVVKRRRHNFYRTKVLADSGTHHVGPPVIRMAGVTRNGTLINSS